MTWELDGTAGQNSQPCAKCTGNSSLQYMVQTDTYLTPALYGQTIFYKIRAYVPTAFDGDLVIGIREYDKTKTAIGYTTDTIAQGSLTKDAWTEYTGSVNCANTSCAWINPCCGMAANATTGEVKVDELACGTSEANATVGAVVADADDETTGNLKNTAGAITTQLNVGNRWGRGFVGDTEFNEEEGVYWTNDTSPLSAWARNATGGENGDSCFEVTANGIQHQCWSPLNYDQAIPVRKGNIYKARLKAWNSTNLAGGAAVIVKQYDRDLTLLSTANFGSQSANLADSTWRQFHDTITISNNATRYITVGFANIAGQTSGTMRIQGFDFGLDLVSHVPQNTADIEVVKSLSNTNATAPFDAENPRTSGNMNGLIVDYTNYSPNNTSDYFIRLRDSTAVRMSVSSDGDLLNVGGGYGTFSDGILKEDVIPAKSQLDDVKQIARIMSNYRLKDDVKARGKSGAKVLLGVVAQELELISPNLVFESEQWDVIKTPKLDENGDVIVINDSEIKMEKSRKMNPPLKAVRTSIMYMKAFKALGELIEIVEAQDERIKALEDKNL